MKSNFTRSVATLWLGLVLSGCSTPSIERDGAADTSGLKHPFFTAGVDDPDFAQSPCALARSGPGSQVRTTAAECLQSDRIDGSTLIRIAARHSGLELRLSLPRKTVLERSVNLADSEDFQIDFFRRHGLPISAEYGLLTTHTEGSWIFGELLASFHPHDTADSRVDQKLIARFRIPHPESQGEASP